MDLKLERLEIELAEINKLMDCAFSLVQQGKITDEDYDKLTAYPFRKRTEVKNKIDRLKEGNSKNLNGGINAPKTFL